MTPKTPIITDWGLTSQLIAICGIDIYNLYNLCYLTTFISIL